MNITTVRARSVGVYDRLDAHFFTAPGVTANERLAELELIGTEVVRLGDIARVWDPPRFARAWARPSEPGIPYLRPYDVFDYLPVASDRLSLTRNADVESLRPHVGSILQTCSGRNLGPCAYADDHLAQFALSHDMIRIEIPDARLRAYVLAFLKTPTGQALLRRGKSGSVIDHLTTGDVNELQVPLLAAEERDLVADRAQKSIDAAMAARAQLTKLLAAHEANLSYPSRVRSLSEGWTLQASQVLDRLDAAYYDPIVAVARSQVAEAGGVRCGELARAILPVRYKRYYVSADHGRPIVSGRQLLQLDPVNLRYVSDRSFKDPTDYLIASGMTIFGAVGRAEGRQGVAALVTADRADWMASNDVMRLTPHPGVSPGAVWLAIAAKQSRAQINALSFGSVIDHMNPEDVEEILVPNISEEAALSAERCWQKFSDAALMMRDAIETLEVMLLSHSGRSNLKVHA